MIGHRRSFCNKLFFVTLYDTKVFYKIQKYDTLLSSQRQFESRKGRVVVVHKELENFVYREAMLMDSGRYEEWLELFTEDSTYWIPTWRSDSETITNPKDETSLVNWDRNNLREYVERLRSGEAHVMIPQPRATRYITNVLVQETGENEYTVYSNWLLHDYRIDHTKPRQQFFGGRMEHRIVKVDGQFKIKRKIVIVNNDDMTYGHLMLI